MDITVGELKKMLGGWPEDAVLDFSGLDFHRFKERAPKLVQVEFSQMVYKDEKTGEVVVDNLE